ncbi:MAG: class I SAM-dependent methyltransferase [Alphaproteobacteria bacterium]|nr:class I SAM-dependent methyltransferase [Alphaproteobacteria bacterium]
MSTRLVTPPKISKQVSQPVPSIPELLIRLRALFEADLRNIEAGLYRQPSNLFEPPDKVIIDAFSYFQDLPKVDLRRQQRDHQEVWRKMPRGAIRDVLPRYYMQNFHFQTDGYLSDRSAELYDHQVDVLFFGGADAMRRQALVPIWHFLHARKAGETQLIDVGCGTGRFLEAVKHNHPALRVVGLDLSHHYVKAARRQLRYRRDVLFVQGNAESLPFHSDHADLVTCVFLLHELPRKIRNLAIQEFARVLRPGGQAIIVDARQFGDDPFYDGLLELFPEAYHEPYFEDYARANLITQFEQEGLVHRSTSPAFLAKVMVFERIRGT